MGVPKVNPTACALILALIATPMIAGAAAAQAPGADASSHGAPSAMPGAGHLAARSSELQPVKRAGGPRLDEGLIYEVEPGDSLGSIARRFGTSAGELASANRMRLDEPLFAGARIRIPGLLAGQIAHLTGEVRRLEGILEAAKKKSRETEAALAEAEREKEDLATRDSLVAARLKTLRWWRAAAWGLGAVTLLLAGLTALTMIEWWWLKRRFVALAETVTRLGRLDQKYRAMLAKAELRFQQLYGRRRPGLSDEGHRARTPEEFEIERLNEDLRATLKTQLERIGEGSVHSGRWARLRNTAAGLTSWTRIRTARR